MFNFKCRWQRFIRGYSDLDWWGGIDYWFTNIGSKLFKELRKNSLGYNSKFDNKEHQNEVLDKIILGLENAKMVSEGDAVFDEEYKEVSNKKYDEKEIVIVSKDTFREAMELFVKYFGSFWS